MDTHSCSSAAGVSATVEVTSAVAVAVAVAAAASVAVEANVATAEYAVEITWSAVHGFFRFTLSSVQQISSPDRLWQNNIIRLKTTFNTVQG